MPAQHALGLLLAGFLMAGCAAPPGAPGTDAPVFSVSTAGEGNAVTVNASEETAIVEVRSQSGIGAASIELVSGTLPANFVVRLHLQGLEEFRLTYEGMAIAASVSSSGYPDIFQSVRSPEAGERPIAPDSPFWMNIGIVSEAATPRIPLDQGYFEITLPEAFRREGRRSFTIHWIDFYR